MHIMSYADDLIATSSLPKLNHHHIVSGIHSHQEENLITLYKDIRPFPTLRCSLTLHPDAWTDYSKHRFGYWNWLHNIYINFPFHMDIHLLAFSFRHFSLHEHPRRIQKSSGFSSTTFWPETSRFWWGRAFAVQEWQNPPVETSVGHHSSLSYLHAENRTYGHGSLHSVHSEAGIRKLVIRTLHYNTADRYAGIYPAIYCLWPASVS